MKQFGRFPHALNGLYLSRRPGSSSRQICSPRFQALKRSRWNQSKKHSLAKGSGRLFKNPPIEMNTPPAFLNASILLCVQGAAHQQVVFLLVASKAMPFSRNKNFMFFQTHCTFPAKCCAAGKSALRITFFTFIDGFSVPPLF